MGNHGLGSCIASIVDRGQPPCVATFRWGNYDTGIMSRFGQNVGYIDELYRQYLADPASVGEIWREFFKDYRPPEEGNATAPAKTRPAAANSLF